MRRGFSESTFSHRGKSEELYFNMTKKRQMCQAWGKGEGCELILMSVLGIFLD